MSDHDHASSLASLAPSEQSLTPVVETPRLRADAAGLTINLANESISLGWGDVVRFELPGNRIMRITYRTPDGEFHSRVLPMSFAGGLESARLLRSTWQDHVLREASRTGSLSGGFDATRLRERGKAALVSGAGICVLVFLPPFVGFWMYPEKAQGFALAMMLIYGAGSVAAALMGYCGFRSLHEGEEQQQLWGQWTLSADGLNRQWDNKVFSPRSNEDFSQDLESLDWDSMHYREILQPVVLAMAERSGAVVRRPYRWGYRLVYVALLVSALAGLHRLMSGVQGPERALRVTTILAILSGAASGGAFFAAHIVERRQMRTYLAQGRDMLVRLGW